MKVLIYQQSKNAMQSGRGKVGKWVLEYETPTARAPDPLMGWTSAGDTLNQVRLSFATADEAVAFAGKRGWDFIVMAPHERKVTPRNYVDNFRYIPPSDAV